MPTLETILAHGTADQRFLYQWLDEYETVNEMRGNTELVAACVATKQNTLDWICREHPELQAE